jgi:hypothetical protein
MNATGALFANRASDPNAALGRRVESATVPRDDLIAAIRGLMIKGNDYAANICLTLKSKCHKSHSSVVPTSDNEKITDDTIEESAPSVSTTTGSLTPRRQRALIELKAGDDEEPDGSIEDANSRENDDSKSGSPQEDLADSETVAEIPPKKSGGEEDTNEDSLEAVEDSGTESAPLTKEGEIFFDIIYGLSRDHPDVIPTLLSVSSRIIREYNPQTEEEKTRIYFPLQIFRIYFDVLTWIHGHEGEVSRTKLTVFSLLATHILSSISHSFTEKEQQGRSEFHALTKASIFLKNHDDHIKRIELVKALLGVADLYILIRVHPQKDEAVAKLNTFMGAIDQMDPSATITESARILRTIKNNIWLARSALFKNDRIQHSELDNAIKAIQGVVNNDTGNASASRDEDDVDEDQNTATAETDLRKLSDPEAREGGHDDEDEDDDSQ